MAVSGTLSLMEIRRISENELSELLSLYAHLHSSDDALPELAVVNEVWRALVSNPGIHCLGGYLEGQLIASCTITVIPNLTRACRPYGLIENVVTHSGYRNRGFGKAVLAHAVSVARAQCCYKVMLLTGRRDAAIVKFYESSGFDGEAKQAFVANLTG